MGKDKANKSDKPFEGNCWEFKKCGHDKLDDKDDRKCPVVKLADLGAGEVCWLIHATRCEGKLQDRAFPKFLECRKCEFYIRKRANK